MSSNRNSKKGKRGFKKFLTGVIAAALAVVLCVTMIPQDALAATADLDTSTKYSESLGDNASTEYAGRIWTDKSVYSESKTFATYGGGSATVTLDTSSEDFLVAFSALATSQMVSGKTQAPLDVVFVIDLSGSMSNEDSNMDNDYSRIYNTIQAVNASINELMSLNDYTRIGVVGFNSDYEVLLPLDRYSQVNNNTPYFSLNTNTASNNEADLYIDAVNSAGNTIDDATDVSGGTNIQMGLYGGLNMLATEENLYADINGSQVKRIPTVILLSDGSPTYSSDGYYTGGGNNRRYVESDWWAPLNNNYDGPGSSPYYGNGMKALMTGAYMKNTVDTHYGVAGTAYETTIYTIGMGITDLPNEETRQTGGNQGPGGNQGGQTTETVYTGEQDLAYITLNPEDHWSDDNAMAKAVRDAWDLYTAGNSPTVKVNNEHYYTLSHPVSNDISSDADALKNLVDEYYPADKANDVTSVFDEILANIIINAPEVPTELKGGSPTEDGYITYTDPIGQYMEVKDVKSIIYAGTQFTLPEGYEPEVNGNTTTYVFTGEVQSSVYGNQNISDIIITVTKGANGNETLVVKIPASVIPVRVNTVELDADGNPTSHTNNGAYPIRVVYSVGMQSNIVENDVVQISKLSDEYISENMNADGTINFYSNLYSGKEITHIHAADGTTHITTVGDATVEFEPSHSNPFYYMQEDVPIYTDPEGTIPATGTLNNDTTYYYVMEYYHGLNVDKEVVARTGKQLNLTDVIEKDGKLYRAKGSPRLNRIMEFEGTKVNNATNTANDFYLPTFVDGTDTADAYDGKYVIYLGNNGVVNYAASGTLEISKSVVIPDGLTGPSDQTFTFTVDFNGATGTYDYDIVNASGTTVGSGTIADGGTLKLADGQKAVIYNLPHNTTYTVTETEVPGFTEYVYDDTTDVEAYVEGLKAEGTIQAGATVSESFKNEYAATPVTVTSDMGLQGAKVLEGRDWNNTDSFRFILESRRLDTPMPEAVSGVSELRVIENSHRALIVTVSDPDAKKDQVVDFGFGNITYTKEGTYEYVISELVESDKIHGVSYSAAMYTVEVTVTDNGQGKLEASLVMTKVLDDAGVTIDQTVGILGTAQGPMATFTNVFDAENEAWIPAGTKVYTDESGANTIETGMFQFKIEALTSGAPMPADTVVGNVDSQIGYEAITFTKDHAGEDKDHAKVYEYKFTEVIPTGAVETSTGSNIWYYQGMYYDGRSYTVKVEVYFENGEVVVDATYPYYPSGVNFPDQTPSRVVFVNTYDPEPTTAVVEGQKTLNGREWLANDSFTFTLTGANTNAQTVLNNGTLTKTVSGAQASDTASFVFDSITFDKPGTYVFNVTETAGASNVGITYDTHTSVVTVTVTDNNGVLAADVAYSDGEKAKFVNTYTTTFDNSTAVTVVANKELSGKDLVAGEFFVEVIPQNNAPMRAVNAEIPVSASGDAVLLDNVTYTAAGVYEYLVTEQIPDGASGNKYRGTTYDTSVYKIEVTVVDKDKVGLLTASWKLYKQTETGTWEEVSEITFNNVYTTDPVVYAVPTLTKELIGGRATALQADEFSFTMSVLEGDENNVILPSPVIVTNDADGNIVFNAVTFKAPGTYKLQIAENDSADPTITESTNKIVAVFNVTDNLDGTLSIERTNLSGTYTFTNVYNTTGSFTLPISKTFARPTGDAWLATDVFEFEVVVLDPDTQAAIEAGAVVFPSVQKVTISSADKDADGNYVKTSPTITINSPTEAGKPYKFVVREIDGMIPGINYDSDSHEIAVTAVDNPNKPGELIVTYTVDGKALATDETINFTNTYEPDVVELNGHQELRVIKNFTGRVDNAWIDSDEFTFTLEKYGTTIGDDTVTLPENASGLKVTNANKAYAHFDNIKFTKAGTYQFKISEVDGGKDYITYDESHYIVTVEVVDNTASGVLEIDSTKLTYEKVSGGLQTDAAAIEFNNEYSVTEKVVGIEVTKELIGRAWSENDAFEFVLSTTDANTEAAIENGIIVLPTENLVIKNSGDTTTATGTIEITFKEAGTYEFHVKEVKGADDNITYDTHTSDVTVTVTDDKVGNLEAAVATTVTGGLTFTNTFTPDPIDVPLTGKKVLDGRTLNVGEFHFRIDAITTDAPMPTVKDYTVSNAADGAIDFGTIRFTKEGTYKYEISEVHSPVPGVEFDGVDVIATVQINKNAAGELVPTVTYAKEDGSGTEFVFNNKYTTTSTDPVGISASKEVIASDGNSFAMAGGDFSFEIEPAATNPASDPIDQMIVTNNAEGTVLFDNAVYEEPGTYVYTIHEVSSNRAGISLDETVYTVTVVVTDDASVAQLQADVTITAGDTEVSAMEFENGYNPTETTAIIHGYKNLLGGHKELKAGDFEFKLTAVGNAPLPDDGVTVVSNTDTGLFQFGAITYTAVTPTDAPHTYTITEVVKDEKGMAYDSKSYTVTVAVTDEGGVLKATVSGITNSEGKPIVVFNNEYIPGAEFVSTIGGTKVLEGRQLTADEFEFALLDKDGKEVATAKNDAEGAFTFANVKFEKAGTYNFTIVEKDTDAVGITYDIETAYGVEVVIVDEGGQLDAASITYLKNGAEIAAADVSFTNYYAAENPATIQIGAVKTLTGRELKAGEFTFLLTGTDGTKLTATNAADGTVLFDEITFKETGKYEFVITEAKGNDADVTYDGSKYTVTVVVTDDLKGNLVAEITSITESVAGKDMAVSAVTFENAYEAPDPGTSPKTHDMFNIFMLMAVIVVAGAGFCGATVYSRRR
ncbi:MAG: VWA domain-containing protein [Eubacterium sp.]|nr:VWA domain-containing protein [Eubacterium sp.]